jgi:3-hydroxymyristoyl/3-hydroxydecanoyl-(acyl carrier protein) dehydratase
MLGPLAQHGLRDPVALVADLGPPAPIRSDRARIAGATGFRSAGELLTDAARVAERLPPAREGSQVLLAVSQDRYAFAAGLLGAWLRGHAVALPPHTGLSPIMRLGPLCAAVIHDTVAHGPLQVGELLGEPAAPPGTPARIELEAIPESAAIHYSEDRDGQLRAWPKRRAELFGEAQLLCEVFGFRPGLSFASTVPTCSQYGLMMSVLVPLVSGGAFLRETLGSSRASRRTVGVGFGAVAVRGPAPHVEPDAERARSTAAGSRREAWEADVLISAPEHLRQLGPRARERFGRVFSSRDALNLSAAAGVIDLFGTTASGSVAWRSAPGPFQPLPGVRVSADSDRRLVLALPYSGCQPGLSCQDRIELPPAGFELRGRADEPELNEQSRSLEARLREIDGVLDGVAVAVVGAGTAPLHSAGVASAPAGVSALDAELRPRSLPARPAAASASTAAAEPLQLLAAVVAPGWSEARLLEALGAHARGVALQCVPEIWRGSTGKPRRGAVFQLFGRTADGTPLGTTPIWQTETRSSNGEQEQRVYRALLPDDYVFFSGHFTGYPILPGAAQLSELVVPCVRRACPALVALAHLSRLKFLERIAPGQTVDVVLTGRPGEASFEFAIRREQTVCTSGRVTFQRAAQP